MKAGKPWYGQLIRPGWHPEPNRKISNEPATTTPWMAQERESARGLHQGPRCGAKNEAPTISSGTVAPETGESQSLKTPDRSPAEVSSPAASSSSSPLAFQPRARMTRPAEAAPGAKPLGAENLGTVVVPPALVIEGAPPEAQIFVDDRLTASTGSDGQG